MERLQGTEMLHSHSEKSDMYSALVHNQLMDSSDGTRRRSSNRSIKRKKFDDELVEYSLGLPGLSAIKSNRSRTQSHTDYVGVGAGALASPSTPPIVAAPNTSSSSSAVAVPPVLSAAHGGAGAAAVAIATPPDSKRKPSSSRGGGGVTVPSSSSRRSHKKGGGSGGGRQPNQITTKDLGRWKPTDDLALIIGVQQTNDLRTVHLGTKFSCKFTVQELQQRWYALLYDQAVSRVAVSAMRNLHPDMIAAVQDKALWSQAEEQTLGTIKSSTNPTIETFADLLVQHPDVFYPGRTANALFRHWQTLRMYHLLSDQPPQPLPALGGRPIMSFNDAEDIIQDSELSEAADDALDRELRLQQRKNIKQIRHLENEVGRWNVLVDSVTGICPGELDGQTLAVLRGRMVRYLMRSKEIIIGRCAKGYNVDIDLTLEGPAYKISRRQGTLRLRNTGEFYLSSEGKRPIFVDGRPITAGNKIRLYDNAVVEISCLRFIFNINHDLIRTIHDSLRYNLPS